jgi:hypothetical protein
VVLNRRDQRFFVVEFSVQHRGGVNEKAMGFLMMAVVIWVESCVERKMIILNPLGVCTTQTGVCKYRCPFLKDAF